MSRRSSCWYSMIVQAPSQGRGSQSCRGFSSHLWSDVAFDQWSTHECNRALLTGRQECLRVVAKSRLDEDRARKLVLPRSSALLHWPSPPLRRFWIFEEFPSSPALRSFVLSICIDAPESITNSPSSGFVQEAAGITQASAGV